jgi:hypothetical protein
MNIEITGDALPWAKRCQAALKSPRMLKVAAAQGAKTVRQHFAELDAKRHRSGVAHHYYAGAARATTWQVSGDDGSIVIDHVGIRLRIEGGTIRPKKAKFLTIPVDAEAQGKRASEFSGAAVIFNKSTGKGVITLGDRVLYALVKKTTHAPDPSVLPAGSELLNDMTNAIDRELDRI